MRAAKRLRRLPGFVCGLVCVVGSVAVPALGFIGCSGSHEEAGQADHAFSSNQATLLDFEFDGDLVTDISWSERQTIQAQLLYTIGHLNHDNSVGRLDNLELSQIKTTVRDDGLTHIEYHAHLPVAWGSKTNLPRSYQFELPHDVSSTKLAMFTEKYKESCVDWGAHDVDPGSMWYYYRPKVAGCRLDDADTVKVSAKVSKSPLNTTKKYPEYHRIWDDDRLEVVAIFGKYKAGEGVDDEGVRGFQKFLRRMDRWLANQKTTRTSAAPEEGDRDVTFEATLPDGRGVRVTALLVDAITNVWPGFHERYEALTPTADLIVYNGHAGLGQNVRALAKMGRWIPQKYQIFFMNGCDTFAYVDGALAQTRAVLNPDDPAGTKYMEFVTNAMPSFFHSMPAASTSFIQGLANIERPLSYDQIFADIDPAEVVLVTGEEDNEFRRGMRIRGDGRNASRDQGKGTVMGAEDGGADGGATPMPSASDGGVTDAETGVDASVSADAGMRTPSNPRQVR